MLFACIIQNADNVLVCKDGSSPVRVTAKVADMGLCCSIKQHMSRNAPRTVRAMSHVAPELQRCGRAGPESDVYSFGILMWEVFTGQAAYRKLLDAGHLYEVRVCHLSKGCAPLSLPQCTAAHHLLGGVDSVAASAR